MGEFEAENVKIVAASVDPKEKALEIAEKLNLAYSLAYGLNAIETSHAVGAFYEADKKFLHATEFLVRPDRTIALACYSTGPVGRFPAEDVLKLVRVYKDKK